MIKTHKDLDVYKRAYDSALEIHKITKNFPKEEQFSLTSQIRRSSKSICANLAEGLAKNAKSKVEFKRFLSICVGSSQETKVWLDFALDLEYLTQDDYKRLHESYDIISKQLFTMIGTWK